MELLFLIKDALLVFRANKKRTFLTILGIVIGVSSVIIIMAVGEGAKNLIFEQISSAGTNVISILPGYSDEEGPPASVMGIVITTLKEEDAVKLKEEITEIESISAYVRGVGTAQYQNQIEDVSFMGVNSEYLQVEQANVEQGVFFDKAEETGSARVVILGWQVWHDLFGDESPLGKSIKIKRQSFRVIGVMEKRGVEGFENQDGLVIMPLKTAQNFLLGINYVSVISAKVTNEKDVPFVMEQATQILKEQHNIKQTDPADFSVRSVQTALEVVDKITSALRMFLAGIAGIALLVGGVGIMNIMLVVVNERTREIGLRKAVGATKVNIQSQFLTESIAITLLGGVIGIILGALVALIIALGANALGYAWKFAIPASSVIVSFFVASSVGLIFGWYPARKASNLEPATALHYE